MAHRLGDECIKNKAALLNYRTLIEKVGEIGKAQLLINMRDSIKITDNELPTKDVINATVTKDPLDSSLESDLDGSPLKRKLEEIGSDSFDEMKKKQKRDEFSCDYCSNNVSFPIFNLLVAHIKGEHASESSLSHCYVIVTSLLRNNNITSIYNVNILDKYIQFRIKKTAQVPFRCHICNFCFPDEKSYNRHINKKTCEKNLKLFEEYTQSLENDDDDDNSDADEVNIF